MKKLKLNIRVQIDEIVVFEDYYEIHYRYKINNNEWEFDLYDGDYDNGLSGKEWKKELEEGVAIEQVIQKISEEYDSR